MCVGVGEAVYTLSNQGLSPRYIYTNVHDVGSGPERNGLSHDKHYLRNARFLGQGAGTQRQLGLLLKLLQRLLLQSGRCNIQYNSKMSTHTDL